MTGRAHRRPMAIVAVLMASAAVTGCTDVRRNDATGPTPSATVPLPPLATVYEGALRAVGSVPWQEARRVDDAALDILYFGSPVECRRLANVRVAETPDHVTITVYEGMVPAKAGEVCPAIAESARVRVTLTEPVGTRRLLDGHATPPAERPAT